MIAAPVVCMALTAAALGGWLMMAAGSSTSTECGGGLDEPAVPAQLAPLFDAAARTYGLGTAGPSILAGLTQVESDFGRNMGPSRAGAVGWTQFLPATWRRFGVDADHDGRADPMSAADAIFGAARYLAHLGAPRDWRRALFGYNHATWYVDRVLAAAWRLAPAAVDETAVIACAATQPLGGAPVRLVGGGRLVAVPGQQGIRVDSRIVADVLLLQQRYRFMITAGFAPTGHAAGGEHPLGLAIDVVPGANGSWDDIDALAHWAEPAQDHPVPPFRWVGYDGDPGHGRGNHLHLSWNHAPDPGRRPPAAWVDVLTAP